MLSSPAIWEGRITQWSTENPLIAVEVNGTNRGILVDNGATISVVCTNENVSTPTHLTHVDYCRLLWVPLVPR